MYNYQECACGSNKIENRDLQLCSSCNTARRKAERAPPAKERKPIAKVSAKREQKLKERREAYRVVKSEQPRCACCGTSYRLTPSHVLTQKKFPGLAANPRNLITLCEEEHSIWENNKPRFALMFPDVWALKMEIMEELAPEYFQQFKNKFPQLFAL